MVEVILAIAVAVIGVLGLVSLSTKSVSNSGFSKRQSVATSYAIQGMEWVRGRRDVEDWTIFSSRSGTYCLSDTTITTWNNSACPVIPGTEFTRLAVLTTPVAGQLSVDVRVAWTEGGRSEVANQVSIFTGF